MGVAIMDEKTINGIPKDKYIQTLIDSLIHWRKMYNMVKDMPGKAIDFIHPVSNTLMTEIEDLLGETYNGKDCPLCKAFSINGCKICPIFLNAVYCNDNKSLYRKILSVNTLRAWIPLAKEMIQLLVTLKTKYENV